MFGPAGLESIIKHITSGPTHTIPQSLDSSGKCQKGWDSICPHSLEESGAFCHHGLPDLHGCHNQPAA